MADVVVVEVAEVAQLVYLSLAPKIRLIWPETCSIPLLDWLVWVVWEAQEL